jgi:hypothetical protein
MAAQKIFALFFLFLSASAYAQEFILGHNLTPTTAVLNDGDIMVGTYAAGLRQVSGSMFLTACQTWGSNIHYPLVVTAQASLSKACISKHTLMVKSFLNKSRTSCDQPMVWSFLNSGMYMYTPSTQLCDIPCT